MRILLRALAITGAAFLSACATQTTGPSGSGGTTSTGGEGGAGTTTTTPTGGGGGAGGQGGMTTSSSSTSTSSTSSSTSSSSTSSTTSTVDTCGDGLKDPNEQCDGVDFGGKTCQSIGFAGGQLVCNNFCAIVASGCTPPENCNNSQDDDDDFQIDCADTDCQQQPVCLDSCAAPFVAVIPSFNFSDTTGRPAVQTASCSQTDGPEMVFQVTSPDDQDVTVAVQSFGFADLVVSVRTACGDPASEIWCQNNVGPNDFNPEQFKISMLAGQTYFIVVDGVTSNDFGQFDIDIEIPFPEADFQCTDHFDNDFDGYLDCDDATSCQSSIDCQPGDQPVGAQCFSATECLADANDPICLGPNEGFADGYCSEFCDLAAPVCSGDGICADPAPIVGKSISVHPVCFDACSGPGDCRPNYDCVDRGLGQNICVTAPEKTCDDFTDNDLDSLIDCQDPDCQPMASCNGGAKATGQPCVSNAECFSNASDPICITQTFFNWPGGYCSQYCDPANDDCGSGALCLQGWVSIDAPVCLDKCNSQADCRPGYSCLDFGFASKICVF